MPLVHWTATAVLAVLPLSAAAQKEQTHSLPDDPAAKVPVFVYRSAFLQYRRAADDTVSPDKLWRSANEEMRGLGGHAGHLSDAPGSEPGNAESKAAPAVTHTHGKGQ